jgi:hypothetical protein
MRDITFGPGSGGAIEIKFCVDVGGYNAELCNFPREERFELIRRSQSNLKVVYIIIKKKRSLSL